MNRILYILILLSGITSLHAQHPLIKKWDYRYGGNEIDFVTCFKQTSDKGYILGGFSASDSSGDKTMGTKGGYDFWVLKIDEDGLKQWDLNLGATYDERLLAIQQTSDGGYLLGGSSNSEVDGDKTQPNRDPVNFSHDFWIVKIDATGHKLWDKVFGGSDNENLSTLQQCSDGGFVLGGSSRSMNDGDKSQKNRDTINFSYDFWMVKIDSNGFKQWDRTFGGSDDDQLTSLIFCSDGGYLLTGPSVSDSSGDKTQHSKGNYDYWAVKVDAAGNKQWDYTYGGDALDLLFSSCSSHDGGFVLGGISKSGISGDKTQPNWDNTNITGDYWVIKIDSVGNKVWDKTYGGLKDEFAFGNIIQTQDSGFVLSGISYSDIGGNKTENNMGIEQSWVIKTNVQGMIEWDKTVLTGAEDECGYVLQSNDGCYVMTNSCPAGIGGDKSQDFRGLEDYWIARFCDSTKYPTALDPDLLQGTVMVYPNPFQSTVLLTVNKPSLRWVSVTVCDIAGKILFHHKSEVEQTPYQLPIDLSLLSKGTYLLMVDCDGEKQISRLTRE